jgi:hypothetical protein
VLALSLSQVIAPRWRNKKAKNMTDNVISFDSFLKAQEKNRESLVVLNRNVESFHESLLNCETHSIYSRNGEYIIEICKIESKITTMKAMVTIFDSSKSTNTDSCYIEADIEQREDFENVVYAFDSIDYAFDMVMKFQLAFVNTRE